MKLKVEARIGRIVDSKDETEGLDSSGDISNLFR